MLAQTMEFDLPETWRNSVVVRHVDEPYSDAALAEEVKDWIEVATLDITDFVKPNPFLIPRFTIKQPGSDFDPSSQEVMYEDAHQLFMDAARKILGPDRLFDARIFFDHASAHLAPGETHTFSEPHLDGTMPGGFNEGQMMSTGHSGKGMTLIGMVASGVATATLQGSVDRDDFGGEPRTHLKSGVRKRKGLEKVDMPLNTLVIMAPSTVHYGQPAHDWIENRNLLRWQLCL